MEILEAVKRVVRARYVGPSTSFSELHVVRAMLLLGDKSPVGRAGLARSLGLGLGVARTLIERLRSARIIKVERGGCVLTKRGLETTQRIKAAITLPQKIDAGKLAVDAHSAAILARNAAQKVKMGLEQRDAAVKAGATGATTIIFTNGKYLIPMSSRDSEKEFPNKVWSEIRDGLAPSNNDVIIVCGATSDRDAEYGALAAALTLAA